MAFQVALRLRDKATLDARVKRGERLSAAELAANHLPTAEAYGAVRTWLTGQGLTVGRDTADRLMIEVHGSVAQAGRALGIGFARVAVRDLGKGNNGDYHAGLGYDLTTGLGSPVMNQLFYTLHDSKP